MSKEIFADRIKRIERNGPSGAVIPGQVGELTNSQARKIRKDNKNSTGYVRRKATTLTSLLFGGILGAILGLIFQYEVGAAALLSMDWQAELALAQRDLIRMGIWAGLAIGATAFLITLPARKKFRRLAGWSFAYLATAIAVNAQELIALVPAAAP